MSGRADNLMQDEPAAECLEQAVDWFLRVRSEEASEDDLPELRRWLQSDSRNAQAYAQVSASWAAVGEHASAPELVVGRRDALEVARQAARQRWSARPVWTQRFAAAAAMAAIGVAVAMFVSRGQGKVYETDLGERRTLTLQDGSAVTLDAHSRVRVAYDDAARLITLESGQAKFSVAKDPMRPFRVRAGNQTIVALGTQFNVEIVRSCVLVTLIEGRVAVAPATSKTEAAVELAPGEQLVTAPGTPPAHRTKVDVARTTAWENGKLFFDNEPLASAAARVNRYAREPIEVDPAVGAVGISGVFKAGETEAFADAVTTYFPVKLERRGSGLYLHKP